MAIDMKTVKAIQYNNKSLKNIKDSNGNIIWGSQSDYPYRKLEYIKFSGAEYVDATYGTNAWNNRTYRYQCMPEGQPTASNMQMWGWYDTSVSGMSRFYTPAWYASTGNGARFCFNNVWTTAGQNWTIGHIYSCRLTTPSSTTGTSQTYTVGLYDNTTSTTVISQNLSANWTRQSFSMYIGAMSNSSHGKDGYWRGRLYYWQCANGNESTVYCRYTPVQRKSDGVCGLYDPIQGNFYPMQGTVITDNAAGPVIDEYWDLTA